MSHISSRITLSPGPLTIFDANGSAVIVHLNPDSGQPGVTGASGGPRIACGVIQPVTDDDDDFDIH
jgi:Cu-Zn family superoxide dismutase